MQVKKLFGTDGVRGVANTDPLTAEMALKLGRAIAHVFKRDERRHRIVIGKDTRLSGYMLENAMVAGICSMGVDAILIGPLPTPGVAYITRSLRADAGVMLSASHNTYEDNGIKFFSNDGYKLPDKLEDVMERLIFSGELDHIRPTATNIGKAFRVDDAIGRYVEFVKNTFPKGMTLEGMKIVLDCAHGAAYKVGPWVLKELGAEVIVYSVEPNGTNINMKCGALHPEVIRKGVIDHKADVGIALDGDGDRVIFADEEARVVDGDFIMGICGTELLREGKLKNNVLVGTVMSNWGLEKLIKESGGKFVRAQVGDRYVIEEMIKEDANFGGEQSGHIIFRDHTTTGDGLVTALQLLKAMRTSGKPLSKLTKVLEKVPQVIVNVRVREKKPLNGVMNIQNAIKFAEEKLGGTGRVLVRYSGTEPIARVMIEGIDQDEIDSLAMSISDEIRKELGD
jgi:phosphoglucosamine mutase